ncbi:MAG: folate family ECF transporter S component [Eubacteriales bacterium]
MRENSKLKQIIIIAMLIAIEMILTRFFCIQTASIRISLGFIPMALCAILYGPLWAGAAYAASDFIGASLLSPLSPFPGFTFSAFLTGLCWGVFLHKKDTKITDRTISLKEMIIPVIIIGIIINLGFDTFWLTMIQHAGVLALLPLRILKVGITMPLQFILVPLIWNKLIKRASHLI